MRKSLASLTLAAALLASAAAGPVPARQAAGPDLTLERIFASREFAPERFGPARWMRDGDSYTTLEASATLKNGTDIVLTRADSGKKEVLVAAEKLVPPAAQEPLAVENYSWSADGTRLLIFTASQRVWRQNTRGDYWVYDRTRGSLRKLGASFPRSSLMFAKFSPDGSRAAYVQGNNIYVETLGGRIQQLTWDGSETVINGTSDWVYEEEFNLRDGFVWSPDGRFIAFWQFQTAGVPDFTMINNTDSLYPKTTVFKYPKAGQLNPACRVGIVPASGGYPVWLDVPGDPRENYIPRMDWAGPGEIIVQRLNRLQNVNDVLLADARSGAGRTLFTDRDEAWVDPMDDFVWLEGGRFLLWLSERDGWRHAYKVARSTGIETLLTPGSYDIDGLVGVDERAGFAYVIASPSAPARRALYRVRLDGKGGPEPVTPAGPAGFHNYQISPNGRWAFHTFSSLDSPPATEIVRLPRHEAVRPAAANAKLRAAVEGLRRSRVEYFTIDIGGLAVDGWCLKPPDFDPAKKYPLLVYVYGEPAGQTVQDRWGGSGYLWHLMLAQQGVVVASFDNRGTPAPRGRAWRKSIYRQIGILASADQAAALRSFLAARPWIDPARVGVWGWSGGGSMTLNALFRYPDLYAAGIAVASVPDELLYDSIYQERYMGLPKDNEEGYRDGSPLTHAKNLKGRLLIIHGTGDDNVHYQGFERLVNELVARGKSFSMMSYPNRSHGIFEGAGTTMHLYRLMTGFLRDNLLQGVR